VSNDDEYVLPDPEASRAYFEAMGVNAAKAAEQSERNPWILEYRRVAAKVAETGDRSLFADYTRRFHASLAPLYPPETHSKW
jgi:hypothetical protein